MIRIPALLWLACLALGSAARPALGGILASQWADDSLPKSAAKQNWLQLPEGGGQDLVIKTANDSENLYVLLATRSRQIKCQLLGAYHQDLSLIFESGDPAHPLQRGVQITFHHFPGAGYPKSAGEEPFYWKAATKEISELAPGLGPDYPKVLIPKNTDLSFDSAVIHGQLTYLLRLPLHPSAERPWSLEAPASGELRISLETSAISPQAAFLELVREYEEEVEGWGWQQQGYGPRRELHDGKGFGLGNYDNWGLDQSLYATHGLYAPHLSWDSVPARLVFESRLQLAAKP